MSTNHSNFENEIFSDKFKVLDKPKQQTVNNFSERLDSTNDKFIKESKSLETNFANFQLLNHSQIVSGSNNTNSSFKTATQAFNIPTIPQPSQDWANFVNAPKPFYMDASDIASNINTDKYAALRDLVMDNAKESIIFQTKNSTIVEQNEEVSKNQFSQSKHIDSAIFGKHVKSVQQKSSESLISLDCLKEEHLSEKIFNKFGSISSAQNSLGSSEQTLLSKDFIFTGGLIKSPPNEIIKTSCSLNTSDQCLDAFASMLDTQEETFGGFISGHSVHAPKLSSGWSSSSLPDADKTKLSVSEDVSVLNPWIL